MAGARPSWLRLPGCANSATLCGTMRALPCLLAGFALFAPWGAQAAGSDPICAQVQAIVADAANGFAKFQGELTKKENSSVEPPTTVDYYAASGAPAGAISCDIEIQETASSDGHHYPNYACQFPIAGADKGAAVRKLANQIVACLPGTS